jgi:hypothetical protein
MARRRRESEPRTLFHGGVILPRFEEVMNYLCLGIIGSGKSLTSRAHWLGSLSRIKRPIGREQVGGIIFDFKKDALPYTASIVGPERIHVLNPFYGGSELSSAIDFAATFETESQIFQLATALFPGGENEAQKFWSQSGQDLIAATIFVFSILAPGRWDLRDVIEALASLDRIKLVLRQLTSTRFLIEIYLTTEVTTKNIHASIRANIREFRPVAAVSHRIQRKLRIAEFVKNLNEVLVLQLDYSKLVASRAVQRLITQMLFEHLLDLDDSEDRRVFGFFDEIQELGPLPLLDTLLSTGRSKGICTFLYTQSLNGLYLAYGKEATHKFLTNIPTRAFFASADETAEWISAQLGNLEVKGLMKSRNGIDEPEKPEHKQIRNISVLTASEISRLLPPSPSRGLRGIYTSRLTKPFFSNLYGLDVRLPKPMPGIAASVKRAASDEVLEPWTQADLERLGLRLGPDDDLEKILGIVPEPIVSHPVPELPAPGAPDESIRGKLSDIFKGFRK